MSENTALHWIVIDEDGTYQLRTLSDSEESALRKAESDIFGLDADWEELAADGYRLVQVAIVPAELVDALDRVLESRAADATETAVDGILKLTENMA